MVARAWTDPAFRARMLADGTSAAREMGFDFPKHHRHLVVLGNTPDVHNVIVCTLCSCTAYTIIGAAPGWHKDLDYRARVVRESRTVLREMGLKLQETTEVRVWDTTTDTRYMVLPVQPPASPRHQCPNCRSAVAWPLPGCAGWRRWYRGLSPSPSPTAPGAVRMTAPMQRSHGLHGKPTSPRRLT